MYPQAHRLRRKQDFDQVYRKKNTRGSRGFVLFFTPNRGGPSRFGVVVSKKTAALAVDRNRLRRRVREILRARLSRITGGYDIVVHIKKPAAELDFSATTQELQYLLGKAGLLKETPDEPPDVRRP
jgi:ribonuclease P protein component